MKYTPSALLSELSGAAGSTVASRNRFGPYLRTRAIPVNPNTADQQTYRNILKAASQGWKNLTPELREAWNNAAALLPRIDSLGRTYYMSGHEYFVSTCQALSLYAGAITLAVSPATIATPADPTVITPVPDSAGTFTVTFAATPVPATTKLVIEATAQLSPGINFIGRSRYKILSLVAPAGASPANVFAAYQAKYGALVADKQIAVRAYFVTSTGGRSNVIYNRAIVA